MPQCTFSRVVRGLDMVLIDEFPEPVPMTVQFVAHADQTGVARARPAEKQAVDLGAHRCHPPAKRTAGDGAGIVFTPVLEHRGDLPHQIMPQSLDLPVRMVDQRLDVALQMSPAPLEPAGLPLHLGTVAVDGAGEPFAQELADRR